MPPVPPERREDAGSAGSTDNKERVPCSYCFGMSVYTKAMWKARLTPECKGIQVNFSASRDRLQELQNRAPHPRQDEFSFMGIGLSVYSKEWMEEGKHMPFVKGLGVIAIRTDNDELMRRMEERKRIKRELRKNAGNRGDLQDGDEHTEVDDEDIDDLFDFDDGDATDDGQALVENEVVPPAMKPRGPTVIPASITMTEVKDRAVEKAKYSVNAMYKFWERRLDGFGDRYVDSCKRLTEQMEKQVTNTPHNVMWLVHRIEEYVTGKDDDGK
ncbi:hypothetical protein BBJ29_006763 [Phytophthora kernoviae]|uniref:Uncharacterized protein n=2 Tax=Phytophthora kernoviae TaxID=325452 RepID=A0A3R7IUN8_9STRA|nr:hypothetical protein BBJ29_006763 [Phytophthora kernoviae]